MERSCVGSPADGSDVLIVEDDPLQREEMADFLARADLSVAVAANCAAAIDIAKSVRPKVVVIDHNLPDGNGLDLAERMRAVLPDATLMLVSVPRGSVSDETLARIGIAAFLHKPVSLQAWRQDVVRLIRSRERPGANGV